MKTSNKLLTGLGIVFFIGLMTVNFRIKHEVDQQKDMIKKVQFSADSVSENSSSIKVTIN